MASSAARVRARSCSHWQEEDDRGGSSGGGLGRAGPVLLGHQVGFTGKSKWFCSFFSFYFVLFNLFATVLNLKIIQTMPKTPLKIFMLLNGLFQKHIKCFRVFGNIFYTSYEYSSKCK